MSNSDFEVWFLSSELSSQLRLSIAGLGQINQTAVNIAIVLHHNCSSELMNTLLCYGRTNSQLPLEL